MLDVIKCLSWFKDFSKEMMTRSKLRNKYWKHKTEESGLLYTQQKNKCVSF